MESANKDEIIRSCETGVWFGKTKRYLQCNSMSSQRENFEYLSIKSDLNQWFSIRSDFGPWEGHLAMSRAISGDQNWRDDAGI